MSALVPSTKADLADKHWLDQKVSLLKDGIEAARDIWANWTEGRNVSRFVHTKDYGAYIAERLGHPLTLSDAITAMPGASTRAIAKVAGVHHSTVAVAKSGVGNQTPAPVLGTDGKTYPAPRLTTLQSRATVRPPKKEEKPPLNVPAIAGVTSSVTTPEPSPLAADAYRLLKQVADLDVKAIRMATTATQHRRLMKVAARAEKVCRELGVPMITY